MSRLLSVTKNRTAKWVRNQRLQHMRAEDAYITIKTFTQSDAEPFMITTGLWSPSSGPTQGQWARQCSKRPGLAVDKCLPHATAPNNPLSLIPAAPSQLYKLLTAHPVNPAAERAVKLHPPSKQHSKLPSLYNMMGAKNSHFPLQASQIESYPLWRRGAPTSPATLVLSFP